MILKDVWGPGYGAESNYVRVYTHRLRKKMADEEGRLLKTVPGIGYQLVARRSLAPHERVERVDHHERAADEPRGALGDEPAAAGDDPGTEARPMKRSRSVPVPSLISASVRTHGRSVGHDRDDLPAHRAPLPRRTTAAMAVGLTS